MGTRRWASLAAFVAASVLNPGYFAGCVSSEPEGPKFQYGAAEMTQLALAANDSFDVQWNGQSYRLDLELAPERQSAGSARQQSPRAAGLFGLTAHACGDRRLFATAAACIDSSSMPVMGKLTVVRGDAEIVASDVPVQGQLIVRSLILGDGDMELQLGGDRISLHGGHSGAYQVGSYDLRGLLGEPVAGR